jgi:uncharacterized Zn finger protein
MEKKDLIKILEDLQNHLHDRTAWPEDVLVELRDTLEDYGLRNENLELRENYKTSDELQDMLRDAIERWIDRLYYFIGDANIYDVSVMYIDNYWNCEWKVTYDDLWNVIENILDSLDK